LSLTLTSSDSFARGSIRDLASYKQAKLLDHAGLAGAFRIRSITPTDADFFVDDNGFFLLGELKHAGTAVSTGQKILFKNFVSALRERCVVFVAEHGAGPDEIIQTHGLPVVRVIRWLDGDAKEYEPSKPLSVFELCRRWTAWRARQCK